MALHIPATLNEPIMLIELGDDIDSVAAIVGGEPEIIAGRITGDVLWAIMGDKATQEKQSSYNQRATHAITFLGGTDSLDPIYGSVIAVGVQDMGCMQMKIVSVPPQVSDQLTKISSEISS